MFFTVSDMIGDEGNHHTVSDFLGEFPHVSNRILCDGKYDFYVLILAR